MSIIDIAIFISYIGYGNNCISCFAFCNGVASEGCITTNITSHKSNDGSSNHNYPSNNVSSQQKMNMCRRLIIGLGLVFFQQFTGQPNLIYYAADIFRIVGFCGELTSTLATVGLGVMKVSLTYPNMY